MQRAKQTATDLRIQSIRGSMALAEAQMRMLREAMDLATAERRGEVETDEAVCPVCGRVVDVDGLGAIERHEGMPGRGCRGFGLKPGDRVDGGL